MLEYGHGTRVIESMAVLEQRVIEFDSAAVMQAFTTVRRVSEALGLHADRIVRIEFQPDRASVNAIDNDGRSAAELRAESLAALLVAYCSRIKVPLPRAAQKNVEITSHSVILRVTTESRPGAPTGGVRSDFPRAMVWNKSHPQH